MKIKRWTGMVLVLLLCASAPVFGASSPWGADYFPNVPLITHEGETVYFFDDLIKEKVVVINFIYTACEDSCPLETARLAGVQSVLGDRVGQDIFMYSITIDPEHDTQQVLNAYAEKYRTKPGWLFLTGKASDITLIRQKLGLYIEEIQDGSNNHNLSLIIGNQATGRWMRRSPFENPYVLANQIGSWLPGWKRPSKGGNDYAQAPKLRKISRGEQLFRTRCTACHALGARRQKGARRLIGPDLLGVTEKRNRKWLVRWLEAPDKMLADKDPIAMALYNEYNNLPMPNMRLSKIDVAALIRYLRKESRRIKKMRQTRHDLSTQIPNQKIETSNPLVTIVKDR